jgi:predicted ester cyclase
MSAEASRDLIHRLFDEVINQWNFAILDQLFAPTFRVDPDDSQDQAAQGPEDTKRFFTWLRSVYPDLQYTIDDIVVEGEKAVARVHAHGTHRGNFHGHPPTDLPVDYSEMIMLRVADNRIAEWWVELNQVSILEQIGAIPAQRAWSDNSRSAAADQESS